MSTRPGSQTLYRGYTENYDNAATMANSLRPSPLSFNSSDSGRQSPFRRQNSQSPATARASTPTTSPSKPSNLSPTKAITANGSLSPEKPSPFVRRPSQNSQASDRPTSPFQRAASPFGRPASSLSIPASPSRQASSASNVSKSEETPPLSPSRKPSPPLADKEEQYEPPSVLSPGLERIMSLPSPSKQNGADQLDGLRSPSVAPDSPTTTVMPSQANLRPSFQRSTTSSTTSTIKQPIFVSAPKSATAAKPTGAPKLTSSANGSYSHVPQPLLRSMRESFEVLDSSNSGQVNSASVKDMLEQLGLPNAPRDLTEFFPPSSPSQLNLARYLDTLSGPLSDLSQPDELIAAFGAFDVDDSGQIDIGELRDALLHTAPEPGEKDMRLSERDVDSILGEFAGRRAFGAKGTNVSKGKGEVFRYRDFMASVSGGGVDAAQADAAVAA